MLTTACTVPIGTMHAGGAALGCRGLGFRHLDRRVPYRVRRGRLGKLLSTFGSWVCITHRQPVLAVSPLATPHRDVSDGPHARLAEACRTTKSALFWAPWIAPRPSAPGRKFSPVQNMLCGGDITTGTVKGVLWILVSATFFFGFFNFFFLIFSRAPLV